MPQEINDECIESTTARIITCTGKRCSIRFLNRSRRNILKILVDDCAIKDGLRCDYLVKSDNNRIEHFVELKGSDVNHAIRQIVSTIQALSVNPRIGIKHSYVIANRIPLATPSIQHYKALFKDSYNSSLTLKSREFEVPL